MISPPNTTEKLPRTFLPGVQGVDEPVISWGCYRLGTPRVQIRGVGGEALVGAKAAGSLFSFPTHI